MIILALVASQDSTVEDVKTNGRRQMLALICKDKEVLFCEYSTIETSVFLDGIISECQEVGIETDTPEQIARYKEAWHP